MFTEPKIFIFEIALLTNLICLLLVENYPLTCLMQNFDNP